MNRLLLIALLILAPQIMRAQSFAERTAAVPAVSEKLDTADYPWNYPYRSKAEMVNDMPPRISRRYRTTASLFEGPQRVDYLWMNNCPGVPDGDSVIASGSGAGCWYRTTFPVITGDSVWIYRKGNALRINTEVADSFVRAILGQLPAGSIQSTDIAHWQQVYESWIMDSAKLIRLDRSYTDPAWLNLTPTKVGAATPSYVDAGVAALKAYSDNAFQPKLSGTPLYTEVDGSTSNELQTLSIAGQNVSLSNGGGTIALPAAPATNLSSSVNGTSVTVSSSTGTPTTFTVPQTTTLPYSAITGTPTIPTQTSQLTNNSGFITSAPVYTAGTGITITSNVVAISGKQTLFYPDVTFTETAVIALGVGTRRITFTGLTGIVTTDRVFISAATLPPTGYVLGDAVCTAAGTVVLSFYGPLIALNGTNTFTCRVTVQR